MVNLDTLERKVKNSQNRNLITKAEIHILMRTHKIKNKIYRKERNRNLNNVLKNLTSMTKTSIKFIIIISWIPKIKPILIVSNRIFMMKIINVILTLNNNIHKMNMTKIKIKMMLILKKNSII